MFEQGEKRRWKITRDFQWEVGAIGSGNFKVIPKGTEFEISVPWFLRWALSPDDPKFLYAALVHDYLLESGIYGSTQAAAEFYDGALYGGAPKWKAKLAYVAVAIWAVYGWERK